MKFILLENDKIKIMFGKKIFVRGVFMSFCKKKDLIFVLFFAEIVANDYIYISFLLKIEMLFV